MRTIVLSVLFLLSTSLQAKDCTPTPHRTTGTHYKPVTVNKINIGKGIVVKGMILSSTDCKPIANAKIAHWQAGENGQYRDQLYAFLYSNNNGSYQFDTEWPNMSVPHIHFIVTAKGYETIETQWRGNERQKVIRFNIVLKKK